VFLLNRVGETGLVPVSTFHTSVRTVRYTAVPCFYISRGLFGVVFSYPHMESLLSILRIPSYSFDKEPRCQVSDPLLSVTFIYCLTARFGPSQTNPWSGTLPSDDFLWLALLHMSEENSDTRP